MNISLKLFFLFLISFFIKTQVAISQQINYTAGYKGILDNREYFTDYSPHYTIFGSLFNTELILKSENHNLNIGLNYFYEYGNLEKNNKPNFHANYHYKNEENNFYFGVFERENLINMHRALLNDTLLYLRPYVEGIFYGRKYKNVTEQIWIDWTSLQADTIRETFLVGQSGHIDLNPFFIKHQFLMLHYSLPKIKVENENIRDNFGFISQFGIHEESFLFLDSATFSAGVMIGMDRIRGIYDWKTPIGTILETSLAYKRFVLNGLAYLGEKQNMFYGDKFYRAGKYSRWDLAINIFNKKNIKGEIVYTLHIVDKTVDHAQAFRIWIDLDYPVLKSQNNKI